LGWVTFLVSRGGLPNCFACIREATTSHTVRGDRILVIISSFMQLFLEEGAPNP